jgi:hypothetical protein
MTIILAATPPGWEVGAALADAVVLMGDFTQPAAATNLRLR